jgi:hypothetical protein
MIIVALVTLTALLLLGIAALAIWGLFQAAAGWEFDRELGTTSSILHQGVLDATDRFLAVTP